MFDLNTDQYHKVKNSQTNPISSGNLMNARFLGFASAIVSVLIMGSFGVLVRYVSVNGSIIAFARFGLGFLFLAMFILLTGKGNVGRTKPSLALVFSGVFLAICVVCYSQAIKLIPLTEAVLLLYQAPLIATVLGYFFLNEKPGFLNAVLLILAFAGFLCLFDFRFSGEFSNMTGQLLAIVAAFSYAFFMIANRKISTEISSLDRAFFQLLCGALVLLPLAVTVDPESIYKDRYGLLAIGFFQGFVALSLMIVALRHLKAYEYATISYLEPIVASVAGFLIFHESLSWLQGLGGFLVLISGLLQIHFSGQTASHED